MQMRSSLRTGVWEVRVCLGLKLLHQPLAPKLLDFPFNWVRTGQLGVWLKAMASIVSQEKMTIKARDKKLRHLVCVLMGQSLHTTAKTFSIHF